MAKKSIIEQIQQKLLNHIQEMEALFPIEMNITIIGRDEAGMGCEFVVGRDSPVQLMGVIERTVERLAAEEAAAKPKASKKKAPAKKASKKK